MKLSKVTQRLVNQFPEWSSVRSDEQSLGFQLANVIGNQLELLDLENARLGKNYFLPTVNLSEIDLVYRYELGSLFTFGINELDITNSIYTPPTVTGTILTGSFNATGAATSPVSILIASNNDIKSFWYDPTPSRIRLGEEITSSHTLLASTVVSSSPYTSFNLPHKPGRLFLSLAGGTKFIGLDENGNVNRTLVTIKGITRKGLEEEETLVFLYNSTRETTKEWKQLISVGVYGVTPITSTLSIKSARFNDGPHLDFWNIDSSVSGFKVDSFWNLGTNTLNNKTLDLVRFTADNPNVLLLGFSEQQSIRQIELLSTSGTSITVLNDLAIQPFTNRIWTCSGTVLYTYDVELPYPNMKQVDKKQYDSITRIEFDSYHKVQGDSVNIDYIFARPIKQIAKHRVSVKYPDTTSYGIVDGSTVSISSDYWVPSALSGSKIRPSHGFTLAQRGDYIFTLETVFSDATSVIDQKIVSAESIRATNQYNLNGSAIVTAGRTITGITFDSDNNMWLLDSTGSKWKILFAFDKMLVDYDQKVIYLREDYPTITAVA